jgi:hypothetical protein
MLGMTKTEGGPRASGPGVRGVGVRQRRRFTREVGPHFRDAGVEAGQTARVVDDEIGARALELSGHLGRDHIQRFRLLQPAITDESLEANRAVRVNEHDAIEFVGEPALEEERDVADDDAVAARVRGGDLLRAQLGDRGVDDAIQLFELGLVVEDPAPEGGAVQQAIGGQHGGSPAIGDPFQGWRTGLNRLTGEDIGIDNRGAERGEPLRNGGLPAPDISGQTDDESHGD